MNLPPKKLIETIIPLDAINAASAREKSIRHGHPSTLHLWWARRPLAAARAVIFAQMVNDPLDKYGDHPTPQQKSAATKKRNELFKIIEDLVVWENTNNEEVLNRAHAAIKESWRETCEAYHYAPGYDPEKLPAFHDPFAGGGAIPLEAQRLGLEAWASDLNPVPVMINKAMIEIPPKFANRPPIGPIPAGEEPPDAFADWKGAKGLAEDVRRYGLWMREEAKKRIGHLYPEVAITKEMAADRPDLKKYVGRKLTVIAWLWARTVKSPNPQFSDVDVPLVSNFILSSKKGKETWIKPVVEGNSWHFEVRKGKPLAGARNGTKASSVGTEFRCIMSNVPISSDYIHDCGWRGEIGSRLMAIVCEGDKGRVYLSPINAHENLQGLGDPTWIPEGEVPPRLTGGTCRYYGFDTWGKLFTKRQLALLDTLTGVLHDVQMRIREDAITSCMEELGEQYANAISVYMSFAINRVADRGSCCCTWDASPKMEALRNTFGRQAISMAWDFAEGNPFSNSSGNFLNNIEWVYKAVAKLPALVGGISRQDNATEQLLSAQKVVSTDPPYYDNIAYADFSDFFYVWLRHALGDLYPDLFATIATPKAEELVAIAKRHGGKEQANRYFLNGMTQAMHNLCEQSHPAFPVTIYYAFKQSESDIKGTSNTGWETFLEAVVQAGFSISGTWPMRTEMANRMVGSGANALASSLVLVCRKRAKDAPEIEKREFLYELSQRMPEALQTMQGLDGETAPIAPVDLAQAAIGPGMEIYSKYSKVLNSDGSRMSVHDAIIEINRYLGSGDFDKATNVCLKLFESHGWSDMPYAEAEGFCLGQGTSVGHIVDSSVLKSSGGRAQLVHWQDYPRDYDPSTDRNRPIWEATHHLVRAIQQEGEAAAGALLAKMPEAAESIRSLAYTLYTLCERRGFAEDARAYNALITSWDRVQMEQMKIYAEAKDALQQGELFA